MQYQEKYLKYKKKYISLKKSITIIGGGDINISNVEEYMKIEVPKDGDILIPNHGDFTAIFNGKVTYPQHKWVTSSIRDSSFAAYEHNKGNYASSDNYNITWVAISPENYAKLLDPGYLEFRKRNVIERILSFPIDRTTELRINRTYTGDGKGVNTIENINLYWDDPEILSLIKEKKNEFDRLNPSELDIMVSAFKSSGAVSFTDFCPDFEKKFKLSPEIEKYQDIPEFRYIVIKKNINSCLRSFDNTLRYLHEPFVKNKDNTRNHKGKYDTQISNMIKSYNKLLKTIEESNIELMGLLGITVNPIIDLTIIGKIKDNDIRCKIVRDWDAIE